MLGLRKRTEPIQMKARRFGYFPDRFQWHGRDYHVSRVERCWTVRTRRWGGRVERLCFRVHCGDGVFDIHQDLLGNTWHIQRAAG